MRELQEETGQSWRSPTCWTCRPITGSDAPPPGFVEDFHAVRIIYAGRCPDPSEPIVHDVGGTTSAAAWIPLTRWDATSWSSGARALLERHLQTLVDAWRPAV